MTTPTSVTLCLEELEAKIFRLKHDEGVKIDQVETNRREIDKLGIELKEIRSARASLEMQYETAVWVQSENDAQNALLNVEAVPSVPDMQDNRVAWDSSTEVPQAVIDLILGKADLGNNLEPRQMNVVEGPRAEDLPSAEYVEPEIERQEPAPVSAPESIDISQPPEPPTKTELIRQVTLEKFRTAREIAQLTHLSREHVAAALSDLARRGEISHIGITWGPPT